LFTDILQLFQISGIIRDMLNAKMAFTL